jgi:geranylgeranyl reductase
MKHYSVARLIGGTMLHVVVVGGGPSGLIAAEATAKAGIRTTLIERAPGRDYPCAGLITNQLLEEFKVPELLLAQRVHEVLLGSPTQRMAFLTLGSVERWAGTMRRDLLQALLKRRAEEAGVTIMPGTFMRFRHGDGDYPLLEIKRPNGEREQIQADVVIGADGASSRVARCLGLPPLELGVAYQERFTLAANAQPIESMQLHFGRKISTDTYGWLLPQSDQLILGVATAARYGRRVWDMLSELKKRVAPHLEGLKSVGREAFCYPLKQRERLVYDRVLLVGDAAGLVTPGVHDGLYYACKSGLFAAQTVIEHQHVPVTERLTDYETKWRAAYGDIFAGFARLEQTFFGNDRQREALIDMAWDRDAQRLAAEAFLTKRRFAPPLGVKFRLKTRQVSQLVKYRVLSPKRLENEQVARAMPAPENYLDLALKTPNTGIFGPMPGEGEPGLMPGEGPSPELLTTVPDLAAPTRPVES